MDSFNPELILMEPEVATVPRESLEIYEQILIGESNFEDSAWIEYEQKCLAVGFLARKHFNADKKLQKRKFELAQR
ncbi:hypothetical protein [uncultured Nostoc sp.]|uniref:hypothetical protein n=1 Tax=uncultured Nostoc sp. TaxID=340711 RepID=UPI0035CB89AF